MSPATVPSGITFAVDEVTSADAPLDECKLHEAVCAQLGSRITSCSDYHSSVVEGTRYQALLAAV